jgi:hypothetical protein
MEARPTVLIALALTILIPFGTYGQDSPIHLDEVYLDESHCLTLPEIRNDNDSPITCYCRDAIVEARYIYFKYLLSGTDRNLNGACLVLEQHAQQMCRTNPSAIYALTRSKDWKWDGPEVVRTYASDAEIKRVKPDSQGFRNVKYGVKLIFRDLQGTTIRTETYSAVERWSAKTEELR